MNESVRLDCKIKCLNKIPLQQSKPRGDLSRIKNLKEFIIRMKTAVNTEECNFGGRKSPQIPISYTHMTIQILIFLKSHLNSLI